MTRKTLKSETARADVNASLLAAAEAEIAALNTKLVNARALYAQLGARCKAAEKLVAEYKCAADAADARRRFAYMRDNNRSSVDAAA